MGAFVLFMFVFASQVIGGFNTKLPPPIYGNTITILSIDGGGIKGIIPAVVLENLEKALQIVSKDEKAALADYFDVIAGTSTGGLIAGMLTAPNPNDTSRPALSAPDVLKFYFDYGPSIFNETDAGDWNENSRCPKFDGKVLHEIAHELLQETRLHDALTNLVIPTYDIKKVQPVIFSSFKTKKVPSLDAKLSDICLATSAAPTILPPVYFKNGGEEFNLVDGAVAASNPGLVAVSEVMQQLNEKNPNFIPLKENVPTKIVLLSLGCGTKKISGIDAFLAQFIPAKYWLEPLLGGLYVGVGDMNEYHLASVFPNPTSSDNYYLRIEEYDFKTPIDNVTKEVMDNLVKVGEDLLEQTVKIQDVISFVPSKVPSEGTNAQALKRLAKILYEERQLRLKRKSMEKRGRPFVEAITSPLRMFGTK